jgi:uncharacterized protein YoaH (UPF0181 family)
LVPPPLLNYPTHTFHQMLDQPVEMLDSYKHPKQVHDQTTNMCHHHQTANVERVHQLMLKLRHSDTTTHQTPEMVATVMRKCENKRKKNLEFK